jgi:Arc/MetJ-type ribon-helix-helix transcriptional regulator
MSGVKPQVSGRVPQDTHEELEEYIEDRGVSQSVAIRRLLKEGLESEQRRSTGHNTNTESDWLTRWSAAVAAVFLGILALLTLLYLDTSLVSKETVGAFALITVAVHSTAIAIRPTPRQWAADQVPKWTGGENDD